MTIQRLLTEAGAAGIGDGVVSVDASGVEAAADWGNLRSPENYVGYERTEHFASRGGAIWTGVASMLPLRRLALNEWALAGEWTMGRQATVLSSPNGRIVYRFHARDLHLVMGPSRRGNPYVSACRWTDSRRALLTASTWTTAATARWSNRVCIS